MAVKNSIRVGRVLREFNIGLGTLVDFLKSKKIEIESSPSTKISEEAYQLIAKEFGKEQILKEQAKKVAINVKEITEKVEEEKREREKEELIITTTLGTPPGPKVVGKIELDENGLPVTPQQEEVEKPKKEKSKAEVAPVTAKESQLQQSKEEEKPTPKVEATKEEEEPAPKVEATKEEEKPAPKVEATKEEEKPVPKVEATKEEEKPAPKVEATKEKEKPAPKVEATKEKEKPKAKAKATEEKATKRTKKAKESKKAEVEEAPKREKPVHIKTKVERLPGLTISGTIDLSQFEKKRGDSKGSSKTSRGKRERIRKPQKERVDINRAAQERDKQNNRRGRRGERGRFRPVRAEVDQEDVQKQIKETYLKMLEGRGRGTSRGARHRRDRRERETRLQEQEIRQEQAASKILKMTEYVTVNELAIMMDVPVTDVIASYMNLGLMVSINQRLDAEALELVADEFGFEIEFVTAEIQDAVQEEEDSEEDLIPRPAIVTVMGHVDHGKTSLLDYIRQANVIAGEAGGITQHIGAYNVKLPNNKRITFLDTPGHEAFTAMRARGAKVTDIAIIIVAADDAVMPQTREAINHATAAGVPMIFAINKIDKASANPEKIKEQLAGLNILVEDWGGKYQSQEVSAKQGLNVDKLLEKVLLEAEMLELRANPDREARGSIIESSLDRGRGYVSSLLVENGTLRTGDVILSGTHTGRIRAMFNERGQAVEEAGPSTPVSVLGLDGAPAAGEVFHVLEDEREARDIASKREQLLRVQGLKTQKHITLEEIGRRIAVGNFQELNLIVKGDVDGSIEALSDSLIKLSNEEIHVNVIHKAVGAISESDVLLAAASNAIIIGFQVRPALGARRLAEREEIEIRLYSVIYDAIEEVKSGIEGMLAPDEKEEITATAEVREIFKISRVGTIGGCMVREGKLRRNSQIRLIRDGIVIHTGTLGSLKRFKDDVREVATGYDCGLNIDGYNDIKVGDMIEAFEIVEIKRTL